MYYANIDYIKHVSFPQLQDLAVSPGIRDPRLNTAECVIEGHETDIMATGLRSSYIRAILWCAFIFSFWAGPFLAEIILGVIEQRSQGNQSPTTTSSAGTGQVSGNDIEMRALVPQALTSPGVGENNSEPEPEPPGSQYPSSPQRTATSVPGENTSEPLISSVVCVCCLLLCMETIILVLIVIFSVSGNAPIDVYIAIGILILEGVILTCLKKCPSKKVFILTFCLVFTSYHFCWLVIGIMINPVWGLTVLLIVCVSLVLLTFLLYQLFREGDFQCSQGDIIQIMVLGVTFCGGCSLVAVAVLAGQSFYGRETADELLKTVLLYVIGGVLSLLSWVSEKAKNNEENAA